MSDSEDDFDDFNEYTEQDSFGSFEEEVEEEVEDQKDLHQHEHQIRTIDTLGIIKFDDEVFSESGVFEDRLELFLDQIFQDQPGDERRADKGYEAPFLSERSTHIYQQLSLLPRLDPPNWIKLKTRRHLLTKLGVPVNLDEILDTPLGPASTSEAASATAPGSGSSLQPGTRNRRASLVSEENINWDGFLIPEFKDLNIEPEQEKSLRGETASILSAVEIENLDHSSIKQLLQSGSDDEISNLLEHHNSNYAKLLELSSVWQNKLSELKKDYEIYESVVQNLVGHTQRLQREEILANLNRVKSKKR